MPKLDLRNAARIKTAAGELAALKGAGFSWLSSGGGGPPPGMLLTSISGGVSIDGLTNAPPNMTVTPNAGGVTFDA